MFYFIKRGELYFRGGKPEDASSWQEARNGCVTFPTESAAQARITELGIAGATPEEF